MKLISYTHDQQPSYGALKDNQVIDLKSKLGDRYPDLKSLIANGMEDAREIVANTTAELNLDQVQLSPVIPNPGTIWCAGMNTHSHYEEAKDHMHLQEKPQKPVLFLRSAATLVASGEDLEKPKLEPVYDYEGEIALVIGKRGRNISVEDALDYVAGYSPFNDASARMYQISSNQITAGKNAYRSGGFGPALVTPDEVDLDTMKLECRVNGDVMQTMPLDDLIFSFAELISYISEFAWLEPGDVIVTGAAEGVGALRDPMVVLKAGDTVEVEVSGVGTLVNGVADQPEV
jgi:2-keto-4-pentenoate hydratase/2-oxohepta-3-ene-1,7-dioic acid hydratase in catechol pathway